MLILHISDMHIGTKSDIKNYARYIASALKTKQSRYKSLFVILTGDLAFSGKKYEYDNLKLFFDCLIVETRNIFDVKCYAVQGNHDIDFDYVDGLEYCKYHNHANELENFCKSVNVDFVNTIKVIELNYLSYKFKISIVNTAYGSKLNENDQGNHTITDIDLLKLNTKYEDDIDYSFVIMHHPYYYFDESILRRLKDCLCRSSDIVFCGHEHSPECNKINNTIVVSGDELSNYDKKNDCQLWEGKGFYLLSIDVDKRKMCKEKFKFCNNIYVSSESEKNTIDIPKNRLKNNDRYQLIESFETEFYRDNKVRVGINNKNPFDYFVFPRLEKVNGKKKSEDIIDYDGLVKVIENNNLLTIYGIKNSSKSTTLKYIFKELYRNEKLPIFVDANDKIVSYDDMVKNAFIKQFGIDTIAFNRYQQEDKQNKYLIIDNADEIDDVVLFNLISRGEQEFNTIILSKCNKPLDVNMNLKYSLHEPIEYNITPFYKDKRDSLLHLIILNNNNSSDIEEEFNAISSILDRFRHHYLKQPMYLIMFVKYYEGSNDLNDKAVFSKLFEFNISTLINVSNYKISRESIELVIEKIAYKIFEKQVVSLKESDIDEVIENYLNSSGNNKVISARDILNIILSSGIIVKNTSDYYFVESIYYSYFVAKRIYHFYLEGRKDEFENIVKYICFNTNLEIAMFVIYLYDHKLILMPIIDSLMSTVETEECYSTNAVDYLSKKPLIIEQINNKPKKIDVIEEKTQSEKKQYDNDIKSNDIKVVQYTQTTKLSESQIIISILGKLILVARAFSTFEHFLDKDEKGKCVKAIFTVPLIIFKKWALLINKNINNYLIELQHLKEKLLDKTVDTYLVSDEIKSKIINMSNEEYKSMIVNSSINVLLELMNMSINESTTNNTLLPIDEFYKTNKNNKYYTLEYLLSLEKRKAVNEFTERIKVLPSISDYVWNQILKKISYHFITHSDNINMKHFQIINSKVFNDKMNYSQFVLSYKHIEE